MALITRANARLLLLFLLVVKTTFATGSSKIAVAGAESASKPDGDVTIRHKKFGARDFLEFGVVKRRIDPELSLDDWQEVSNRRKLSVHRAIYIPLLEIMCTGFTCTGITDTGTSRSTVDDDAFRFSLNIRDNTYDPIDLYGR